MTIKLYTGLGSGNLAPEGGIDITRYKHVGQWLRRIESVPHFWPMPRIPGLPPLALVAAPVRE